MAQSSQNSNSHIQYKTILNGTALYEYCTVHTPYSTVGTTVHNPFPFPFSPQWIAGSPAIDLFSRL